jgi:hypothetical protein
MELRLITVNCGVPGIIGWRNGRPVRSAIIKAPVETENAVFGGLGIVGDNRPIAWCTEDPTRPSAPTRPTIGRGGRTKKS